MISHPREPDTWHLAARGLVHMLVVPQGFTLSVTGVFAITVGHRGFPPRLVICLFVVGAGLGFCGITVVSQAHREASGRPVTIVGAAMINLLPAAVVPAACGASWWVGNKAAAFVVAGVCVTVFYLAGLAAFLVILHSSPGPRRGRQSADTRLRETGGG